MIEIPLSVRSPSLHDLFYDSAGTVPIQQWFRTIDSINYQIFLCRCQLFYQDFLAWFCVLFEWENCCKVGCCQIGPIIFSRWISNRQSNATVATLRAAYLDLSLGSCFFFTISFNFLPFYSSLVSASVRWVCFFMHSWIECQMYSASSGHTEFLGSHFGTMAQNVHIVKDVLWIIILDDWDRGCYCSHWRRMYCSILLFFL